MAFEIKEVLVDEQSMSVVGFRCHQMSDSTMGTRYYTDIAYLAFKNAPVVLESPYCIRKSLPMGEVLYRYSAKLTRLKVIKCTTEKVYTELEVKASDRGKLAWKMDCGVKWYSMGVFMDSILYSGVRKRVETLEKLLDSHVLANSKIVWHDHKGDGNDKCIGTLLVRLSLDERAITNLMCCESKEREVCNAIASDIANRCDLNALVKYINEGVFEITV